MSRLHIVIYEPKFQYSLYCITARVGIEGQVLYGPSGSDQAFLDSISLVDRGFQTIKDRKPNKFDEDMENAPRG